MIDDFLEDRDLVDLWLFRWKVSNPLLIAATAEIGLIAFPIVEPAG